MTLAECHCEKCGWTAWVEEVTPLPVCPNCALSSIRVEHEKKRGPVGIYGALGTARPTGRHAEITLLSSPHTARDLG